MLFGAAALLGVAVWAWFATNPEVFAPTCVMGWLLLALSGLALLVLPLLPPAAASR